MTFKVKDGLKVGSTLVIDDSGKLTTALTTPRTIALGGSLSGSTNFDGSSNVTISATVADNSHNHTIANVTGLQTALDDKTRKYTAIVRRAVWSRIARFDVNQLFGSVIISMHHTRNSVVVGNTFLLSFGHFNKAQLVQLAGHDYAQVQVRVTEVGDGKNVYYEVYDDALSDGTDDNDYSITLSSISCTPTIYTAFTDGSAGGTVIQSATTLINSMTVNGSRVWTNANDGAGSGLDADLLDGLNSASSNTASTIVARDASGNFSAGTITANLTGSVTGNASTATTLQTARAIGDVAFNGSADIVPQRIAWKDTRSTNFNPLTYNGVTLHLKANGTDGLSDGGSYHGTLNIEHWGDLSGGNAHQLAFTDNNNMWLRQSASTTTWGSWNKVLHDGNYSSYALPVAGGTISGNLAVTGNTTIGAGTTSPGYNLDVQSATNAIIRAYGTNIGRLSLQNSTRHYSFSVQGSSLLFYDETGVATRATLDSSGNLSLGTTTASTGRFNAAAANGTAQVYLTGSLVGASNQGAGLYFSDNADNNLAIKTLYSGGTGNYITINPGNTEVIRFQQNGNVGIGTTSPAYRLSVATSLSPTVADFASTAAGDTAFIGIKSSGGTYAYLGTASGSMIFQTPGSSYSTKMTLDSVGNLGIGTTAPTAPIALGKAVYGTTAQEDFFRIKIQDQGGVQNDVGIGQPATGALGINFTAGAYFAIYGGTDGERLRLDGSGNLGLGVTPSSWNSVIRAIDVGTISAFTGSSASTEVWNNSYYSTGSAYVYKTTAAASRYEQKVGSHIWWSAPSGTAGTNITFNQAMTLDSSGRLSVGNTSPQGSGGTITATNGSYVLSADNATVTSMGADNTGLSYIVGYKSTGGTLVFHTANSSGVNTERMRLDQSGRLQLGITSALTWTSSTYSGTGNLTISGSGEQNISVVTTDTNSTRAKLFVASGGQSWGLWHDGSAAKDFVLGCYTSEWLRLTTAGNLGIGVSAPAYKLHVAGTGHVQDYLRITNTSGAQLLIMGNQDSVGANNPSVFGAANGTHYFGNGNSWAGSGGTITWHSNFNSTGLGLGLGTTGPSYRLHVSGTGFATSDFRAPIFYDSADTNYYADLNSLSRLYALQVDKGTTSDRDKIRLWNSNEYTIGMASGYNYGGLEDWAMTFQFSNHDSRGFWWGDTAHTANQGAMALTTNGKLTVAHSVRIGFGEDDVAIPGSNYRLEVNGAFAATTKSFLIEHPTKPGMKLRYGSLEGPENGVYVRGRLKDGNVIDLPEYWTKLVDPDSITVQLTPIGKPYAVWVESVSDNQVTVGYEGNKLDCYYVVFAERVDVDKLEVEIA